MTVRIRNATANDAPELAAIINEIIKAGGSTAHQSEFNEERITRHYIAPERLISCKVAEMENRTVGFQTLVWPDDEGQPFPEGWAIIASFVRSEASGRGIGRGLFDATCRTASNKKVKVIDATIRADNDGGLAYYSSLGFTDYDILRSVPLRDGRRVDRIRKQFIVT